MVLHKQTNASYFHTWLYSLASLATPATPFYTGQPHHEMSLHSKTIDFQKR
jgi:hypothetical protein